MRRTAAVRFPLAALSALVLAGALVYSAKVRADETDAEDGVSVASAASVAAAAPAVPEPQAAAGVSPATTIDAYKRHFSELVYGASRAQLADALPPILKSVVVLDVTVNGEGQILNLAVWRSNGYEDLEEIALASVRKLGAVVPAPSDEVRAGQSALRFLETWLFRHDGRFQVRSMIANDAGTRTARR
jgi:protein TonB